MLDKLKAYKNEHGHCQVPIQAHSQDPELGSLRAWVKRQRVALKGDKNTRSSHLRQRKVQLDEIGFVWCADNWDNMYKQLKEFHREHGHCEAPKRYAANRSLGVWSRKQRRDQNKLSKDHRVRLDEAGCDFESQTEKNERRWNEMLQRLKRYKQEYGDCLFPNHSSTKVPYHDKELSVWVSNQRTGYKHDKMPNHRIEKLEEVGFVWSLVERGPIASSEKHEHSVGEDV
jgi:hypothetical protein